MSNTIEYQINKPKSLNEATDPKHDHHSPEIVRVWNCGSITWVTLLRHLTQLWWPISWVMAWPWAPAVWWLQLGCVWQHNVKACHAMTTFSFDVEAEQSRHLSSVLSPTKYVVDQYKYKSQTTQSRIHTCVKTNQHVCKNLPLTPVLCSSRTRAFSQWTSQTATRIYTSLSL